MLHISCYFCYNLVLLDRMLHISCYFCYILVLLDRMFLISCYFCYMNVSYFTRYELISVICRCCRYTLFDSTCIYFSIPLLESVPKTLQMELNTTLLNTQHFNIRFKGRLFAIPGNGVKNLPYTLAYRSYRKGEPSKSPSTNGR